MFLPMFVTYASSAFVPIRTMPSWLHGFAGYQPTTPVIETLRGLLLHGRAGGNAGVAVAWCAGILAGSGILSALAFRRRTG
jgi:ABC-2 type transport system permease protein